MKLTGILVEKTVSTINLRFSIPEVRRAVRYKLDEELDNIATYTEKMDIIFEVVEWSGRRDKIPELFDGLITVNPIAQPELKEILELAVRPSDNTTGTAPVLPAFDPLSHYFIADEPFVDREQLRNQLDSLWQGGRSGVLIVRGERYSGRSHSWWLIHEMARQRQILDRYFDLSTNPGEWRVDDLVSRIAVWLDLPRQDLKDRLAQESRRGLALLGALYRYIKSSGNSKQRW